MSMYLQSTQSSTADVRQLLLYCCASHIMRQKKTLCLLKSHCLALAIRFQQIKCHLLRVTLSVGALQLLPSQHLHRENKQIADQNCLREWYGQVTFARADS